MKTMLSLVRRLCGSGACLASELSVLVLAGPAALFLTLKGWAWAARVGRE